MASLAALLASAVSSHACALWEHGTQTVFGEALPHARLMLEGEQPDLVVARRRVDG